LTPRRYGPLAYVPITRRPKRDAAKLERAGAARHGYRRAFFVTGQPHRIGALDTALEYICSHAGVWRATGWEIVQRFLAQQSKRAAAATYTDLRKFLDTSVLA
jgi:uncharacterized protein YjaZ